MYTFLGLETLKNSERMEVGVVSTPDVDWAARITPFLGHKDPEWLPQIADALTGPLNSLVTRFYVGQIGGRLACQTMMTGYNGVGILGHVFTRPEDRRKGAIQALLESLMSDVRQSFRILTLGTELESPAYRIYEGLSFRSIGTGHGEMIWRGDGSDTTFDAAPVSVRPVRWEDWPFFNLIAALPVADDEDLPRGPMLGLKAQGSVEGAFLKLQARRAADPRVQALALVGGVGAVGWALCGPDAGWHEDHWLLDLHAAPAFTDRFGDLMAAIDWSTAPVVSYLTQAEGAKATALRAAGFEQVAVLPNWLMHNGICDVVVMMRQ